jgi:ribosomal protein S4
MQKKKKNKKKYIAHRVYFKYLNVLRANSKPTKKQYFFNFKARYKRRLALRKYFTLFYGMKRKKDFYKKSELKLLKTNNNFPKLLFKCMYTFVTRFIGIFERRLDIFIFRLG